ncbi:TetR family transcriptional regulator [Halopseudomonas pelagia]|uniref:TetR family transcriptional regulator n=1 Tax=Halopseudomonas pelagia TaxID=553151 RepID=UPI00039A0BCD|nr:TetR family transcriptional regulator [Halopseudomonas pelagia]|tara:strand:- start:141 stop:773 length:633 start_codon:yes stop_codon:yes gene_type:complete
MARRSSEDAARTRLEIISAAAKVFCREGITGATLEEIALEAGITRGAIYWHFKGKQGLLQALLNEHPLPLERPMPPGISFAPGWERLGQALEETMSDDIARRLSRIMLHKSERVAGDDPVESRLQRIRSSFIEQLRTLLINAMANDELADSLDIDLIGDVFQSCISGLLFDVLREGESNQQKIPAMLDTLRHLLFNPPAHWLRPEANGCT